MDVSRCVCVSVSLCVLGAVGVCVFEYLLVRGACEQWLGRWRGCLSRLAWRLSLSNVCRTRNR